jgi:hypothetical protein
VGCSPGLCQPEHEPDPNEYQSPRFDMKPLDGGSAKDVANEQVEHSEAERDDDYRSKMVD